MVRDDEAYELTGIPAEHGKVFQSVADSTGCMIASRAVGKYATGLILEGYASKGFHNKAKSCNWGPMAGFVLADPRFTKAPEVKKQAEALTDAAHYGAEEVPVIISPARRRWLLQNNCMRRSGAPGYYVADSPQGGLMLFVLRERFDVRFAEGRLMWAIHYARSEARTDFRRPDAAEKPRHGEYLPVLAMRDPFCSLSKDDYRSATTGDYDLFAIFARKRFYQPDGRDKRMVGHASLEAAIRSGARETGEDEHMGNMTLRISELRNRLNTGFLRAGYTGGNMVHHSDEGGRPFVRDVDLPVFAVVPRQNSPYGIQSVEDLRQFISVELGSYAPVFNPGWMKQMVFHSDASVAQKVHTELTNRLAMPNRGLRPPVKRS